MKFIYSRVLHNGDKCTLSELRTRFWINKAYKFISSVIKNCFACKKVEGPAYKCTPARDLSLTRVLFAPVFKHTGADYATLVFAKKYLQFPESV